jgi:TetR/AcrR family transcriptional regulator, transcriptional repressor for nem operon
MNKTARVAGKASESTRRLLIDAAFAEIHEHGFRPTGLDAIVARAELTKGAVYHHFDNKSDLGHAVFDEVVVPWVEERWIAPVRDAKDVLGELIARVRKLPERTPRERAIGCPFGNLVLETSDLDDAYRERVKALLGAWSTQLAADLRRGQREGTVRADIRPAETAAFLVAALEGVVGIAKAAGDTRILKQTVAGFVDYLRSLRPA